MEDQCENEAETIIRYVPEWKRGTATAAGSKKGLWENMRVSDFCADLLCDGEWVELLE